MGDLSGAAIALNPKTGEIYALVSTPSYDPNTLATHDTESAVAQFNDLLNSSNSPLSNRAIAGTLYHPGSVFKLVVAAAALDSGTLTTSSQLPNPATLQLPQSTAVINNSTGGPCGSADPTVTMVTALQYSCNIPFAEIGRLVGERTLQDYAEGFGFGATIEIPMAATRSTFPSGMDDAQLMVSSFGQFDVRVSPLQIAMVTSAIANGGILMQPTVVDSVLAADLRPLREFESMVYSTPISAATADSLVRMMVLSVDSGAASNARIPGVSVAGKTGTAENGEGEPYTLWFTGFAPSDNPEVVVAVVIENGGGLGQSSSGNAIAAPIARKIIEAVLAR
jgi:peptidoglycan glycosyltransferase